MDVSGNIGPALLLTTLAGLSTGIGGAIAYFIKKPKTSYLSFSLGLSAGVMIYVSFVELLPKAFQTVDRIVAVAGFFLGMIIIFVIDMLIPEFQNPHHYKAPADLIDVKSQNRLLRTGFLLAIVITIHNIPEGLVTFSVGLSEIKLAIVIAIAIAIHNIPEGISVSVPLLYATGNKNKAFFYAFLSGLAEPLGAVLGFLVIAPFLSEAILAILFAITAGIMVYISIDELLPMAHRYGQGHVVIFGVVSGMFIMAASLLFV
jgi:zinc transporter, ZIP family